RAFARDRKSHSGPDFQCADAGRGARRRRSADAFEGLERPPRQHHDRPHRKMARGARAVGADRGGGEEARGGARGDDSARALTNLMPFPNIDCIVVAISRGVAMSIPDYQTLMLPVLRAAAGGETRVPE